MQTIANEINSVGVGESVHFENLTLFPLFRTNDMPETPDYSLLEYAIEQGTAKVTEVSNEGSVPDLQFSNTGDKPVLLLDGEELIGAKQNRVVNLTILAPAQQAIVIPVSCVEALRWDFQTDHFHSSERVMYSRARAAKSAQVTHSMSADGTRRSDQSAVWQEIAEKSERLGASSPTQAMSEIYEKRAASIDAYLRAFSWVDRQAGLVFAIGSQLFGLDLFDHAVTMRAAFPKLLRSYALDAIEAPSSEPPARDKAVEFLRRTARSTSEHHDAVGLGKDIRLTGDRVSGAALWAAERYVHICSFTPEGGNSPSGVRTRISRPSGRRAH
jgi:hypothetical protein